MFKQASRITFRNGLLHGGPTAVGAGGHLFPSKCCFSVMVLQGFVSDMTLQISLHALKLIGSSCAAYGSGCTACICVTPVLASLLAAIHVSCAES